HRHFSLRPGQGPVGRGPTESMVASDTGLPTRREAVERLALQRGVWHGTIQNPLERGTLGIVRPDVRVRHYSLYRTDRGWGFHSDRRFAFAGWTRSGKPG